MLRSLYAMLLMVALLPPVYAQETDVPTGVDRSSTGGAQTLADILARQRGEAVDDSFRRSEVGDPANAPATTAPLGTLGGVSDPEIWRAIRFGSADVTVSAGGDVATILMQNSGIRWLQLREGPLATYGAYLLGATLLVLALFYAIRGKIRIDGGKTGRKILRFTSVERFGHWLLAGSFIVLGLTGLISLFGRKVLIPLFGHESFSTIAIGTKWVHNNISWAFILGLVMILVMWVAHNIPNRTDLAWIAKAGGIFTKGVHPPAKKFNAGQKLIFWAVILLGGSISVSGLSLLFPFELPIFAPTFAKLNALGLPQVLGLGELRTALAPQEEMQLAQLWHTLAGFVLMAIIIAHIYIGSLGMEGAYDAMATGEVEEQWAREHHSIWVAEVKAREAEASGGATPAE